MAYVAFDGSKPDPTTQGMTDYSTAIRDNLEALRDAVVAGCMPGWAMATSGGTEDEPAAYVYSKGSERVKLELTWGTTGGSDGNVTQMVMKYSSDSGSNYDTVGTASYTYSSNGYCTAIAWA